MIHFHISTISKNSPNFKYKKNIIDGACKKIQFLTPLPDGFIDIFDLMTSRYLNYSRFCENVSSPK